MYNHIYLESFERDLKMVRIQNKRIENQISEIYLRLEERNIYGAFEKSASLNLEAEQLAVSTRVLPGRIENVEGRKIVKRNIRKTFPIKIGYLKEGWFCLLIPALLPRKGGPSTFHGYAVQLAVEKYFKQQTNPHRFPECVVAIRHVYRHNRPQQSYRNHNNVEVNFVVNAFSPYVLVSKSPLNLEHYYCSMAGEEDRTEVFVIPQSQLKDWLETRKHQPLDESELLERVPDFLNGTQEETI